MILKIYIEKINLFSIRFKIINNMIFRSRQYVMRFNIFIISSIEIIC